MVKISVVVPCYNAAGHLKALLESLKGQDQDEEKFEVIIVDDGSADETAGLVSKYPFKYFFQENKGAGPARNLGAEKAIGRILLFTDSDCIVPPDWIKSHLRAHRENGEFGIIAGGVKKPKGEGFVAWADFLSTWFNAHEDLKKQPVKEYVPTLNMSVKKRVFNQIGGFWKRKLTGEDVEFCFRARKKNVKILFDPSLSLRHQKHKLPVFLKHNFNWGHHAPFVRGQDAGLSYHFLFSGGFVKSLVYFFPVVFGHTYLLARAWINYQPIRLLFCLPLIFLGKIYYGFGFLSGSWEKYSDKK